MFRVVASHEDFIKAMMIRGIVFISEQNVGFDAEIDAHEWLCLHILGERERRPFGAGRIRFDGPWARLERIAILKPFRRQGLGHRMVEFML